MAGYKNNRSNGNSRNNSGNNNSRNNGGNYTKHSGCGMKLGSNNKTTIYGWNASKSRGLLKFVGQPTGKVVGEAKGSQNDVNESKLMYICNLTFLRNGEQRTVNGVYNTQTGKLYIPALGMVANPKAPNGGYFGISKKP